MRYVVFHTHGEGLVMSPQMVDQLRKVTEVIDVREVRLWSMQPEFWRGLEDQLYRGPVEFVLWGPSDRYGCCPVPQYEARSYSDVLQYVQGYRPTVRERDAEGRPSYTVWAIPVES